MVKKKRKIGVKKGKEVEKKEDFLHRFFAPLTDEQLAEMEFMLSSPKYTIANVIEVVQQEWGHLRDKKFHTMRIRLVDYNVYILKPKIINKVSNSDVFAEVMTLTENYDSIKELTITARQQRKRVDRALYMEERAFNEGVTGKEYRLTCSQARQEIKLLGEMIEKLAALHIKTGAIKVVPKHITGSVRREGGVDQIQFTVSENFMDHIDDIEAEIIDIESEYEQED